MKAISSRIIVCVLIGLFVFSGLASTLLFSSASTSSSSSTSLNWLTYHKDLSRDGLDNTSNTSPKPSFDWSSKSLDGAIYAEPLVYNGLVIAATENNSVYAIKETTGHIVWHKNLGLPVPGNTLPCGDINPSGITGTPAIDPVSNIVYVVAYLINPTQHHVLFGIDLTNGHVVFRHNVDPKGVSVLVEQQRGALAIANRAVYVPYGDLDGDCGQYHGYVVGWDQNGTRKFQYMDPTGREGGIWGPSGPAIDSSGNLYVATGNSANTTTFDFGDALIKLSPTLKEIDYFAPTNWAYLNGHDVDLGSIGPSILNNSGLIFQAGKEGVGYLLNMSNLGGIGGQLFSALACPGGSKAYGGTALENSVIYVPCTTGLAALKVNFSTRSFTSLWNVTGIWAGAPIISANLVWTVDVNSGTLYALNPVNGASVFRYSLGSVAHFISPSASNGLVFVGANNEILVFHA